MGATSTITNDVDKGNCGQNRAMPDDHISKIVESPASILISRVRYSRSIENLNGIAK